MPPHAKVVQQHAYQERPRQRTATRTAAPRQRDDSTRWAERIAREIEAFAYAISPDIEVEQFVPGAPRSEEALLAEAIAAHLCAAGNETTYLAESIISNRTTAGGMYRPSDSYYDPDMAAIDGTIRLMQSWYQAPTPTTAEAWIESLQAGHRIMLPHQKHQDWFAPGTYRGKYDSGHPQLEDIEIPPPNAISATLTAGFCAAQCNAPTEWRRHAVLEYVMLRTAPFRGENDRIARAAGVRHLPCIRPIFPPHIWSYWDAAKEIMAGGRAERWLHCLAEAHRRGADIQPHDTATTILTRWGDRGWSGAAMHSAAYRQERKRALGLVDERGPFNHSRIDHDPR